MNQYVYQSLEDAAAALEAFFAKDGAGDSKRAEAADCLRRSEESFQRCDTDGFLSQWALDCTASKLRREAELADAGGHWYFQVLVSADGEVVAEKRYAFPDRYSPAWTGRVQLSWKLNERGQALYGRKWLPDFNATKPARKGSLRASLGFGKAYVIAPGFVSHRDPLDQREEKRGMPTGMLHYDIYRDLQAEARRQEVAA